jgi:hypothetical protein
VSTEAKDILATDDLFDHPHQIRDKALLTEQADAPLPDDAALRMAQHRAQVPPDHRREAGFMDGILAAEAFDPYYQRMMAEHEVAKQKRIIAQVINTRVVQTGIKTIALYNRTKARIEPYVALYVERRKAAKREKEILSS